MRDTVVVSQSFGAALLRSARYLINAAAYAIVPHYFSRRASAKQGGAGRNGLAAPTTIAGRRCCYSSVPLVLPALVNLAIPYRLTADWTYPNWALLPVVLYASRDLIVDERAVARAGLVALAVTVVALSLRRRLSLTPG